MDKLWRIVEKEAIKVIFEDLSGIPEKIHGLYLYDIKTGPVIVLDVSLNSYRRLKKCVLAEEIGHYYTAPRTNMLKVYTSANQRIMQSQDERKAMQWATDFLIPDAELTKALKAGCRSCFELAEHFDVTEWFIYRKLGLLKMCFRRTGPYGEGTGSIRGRDVAL